MKQKRLFWKRAILNDNVFFTIVKILKGKSKTDVTFLKNIYFCK